ncbi:NAD(P)-binding protein [Aspergillus steynii IBT 23096]|uniref:NAD(P)-binding protein n=1 Tax=Aspergillus steynii IBT 23096 TaxID=1392250 RepID=A0A2I2GAI3_9EURO|nr:NAD(P)-binding protein [Aspergillus steynii IBT 23096]PLB49885.1 NAD(P)-binding protein [Aspergillus steynii IBT 23096]
MKVNNLVIPFDSEVAVIGANGYIGVETCEKLLQAGYRVRGTVRDVEQQLWMRELFEKKWPGKFNLVCVKDFEVEDAFDMAFKGVAGVIYVSTPVIFSPDQTQAIDRVVKGTINTLEAAARAGVKRYVLSSSSKAVESTVYNVPHVLDVSTFNYDDLQKAREEPTVPTFERALRVYSAGRTAAELAFWDWIKNNNPPFVANVVVPDGNFGRVLDIEHTNTGPTSSVGMLKRVLAGEREGIFPYVGYLIDVQDTARLLVAALSLSSVAGERIFAYNSHYTWNELRHRVRRLFPDRPEIITGEDYEDIGRDLGNADDLIQRSEALLREVGQPSFTAVDDMLRDFVSSVYSKHT